MGFTSRRRARTHPRRGTLVGLLVTGAATCGLLVGPPGALARGGGGTTKPPARGTIAPWVVATLPTPSGFGTPAGSVAAADLPGFHAPRHLGHCPGDAPP